MRRPPLALAILLSLMSGLVGCTSPSIDPSDGLGVAAEDYSGEVSAEPNETLLILSPRPGDLLPELDGIHVRLAVGTDWIECFSAEHESLEHCVVEPGPESEFGETLQLSEHEGDLTGDSGFNVAMIEVWSQGSSVPVDASYPLSVL